jgi:HEPN domain-containing protein
MGKRRHINYSDSTRYRDWLERSCEDIACARLLKEEDKCHNSAAFHCQQCIEKALKAYILLKSDQLVDGHNLTWLCRQAMRYDKRFDDWLDESASLNKCYIETRYPADLPLALDSAEVARYCDMAGDMYAFIRSEFESANIALS